MLSDSSEFKARLNSSEEKVSIAATGKSGTAATALAIHHIGVSVADLDAALAFWEQFLGVPARWRTILDRPYLSEVVGVPGVSIEAAFIDLPGGAILELLDYRTPGKVANSDATPNPGNVHFCLAVEDAPLAWRRAVACGAKPVSPGGPIEIDGGPNIGARGAYLRVHDGVTLELFQPPKRL
jgi:catechol 2,3-dioxygenase-like lactoylglutathione lyase family enzyme